MKINTVKNSPNFGNLYNNKFVLKGLEKISDHGASFAAMTAFLASITLRPAAIKLSPHVDKKNKNYAQATSIASGIMKLLVAEAVAIPIEKGVKAIDKNPEKFLKKETIEAFKGSAKNLNGSREYKFAGQVIKLGANLLSAIPKSVLTIALIPILTNILFKKKEKKETQMQKIEYDSVFAPVQNSIKQNKNQSLSFGRKNIMAKGLGKIFDTSLMQKFAKKYVSNDTNIAKYMSNATDILLTGAFVLQTKKSKKIEEENKNPLIYNSILSTGISIAFGSLIDSAVKKLSKGSLEKFKAANALDPKLSKYIEGINILRPTLIFAFIYYGLLPFFTVSASAKLDKMTKKKE